jgi:hypothetical protein
MSDNSFKARKGLTLAPISAASITNPELGDIICDSSDSNKIKKWDGTAWVEIGSGAGAVASASNVGAGSQVFKQLSGTDLQFRTLVAGISMQLTQGTDTITIDNIGLDDGLNLGTGTGIFAQKLAGNLEFKSLTEGAHIDFTSTSTEINAKVKNIATPQLNWVKDTNGPITEFIDGFLFESFDNISAQEIYAILNVPNTYIAGSQITLKNGEFFCADVSPATVQFQSVSTLINSSTVLGTYTNTYTSTNAAVTLSATSDLITSIGNIDLTNSSGQINAVAVQPGDKIRVKLYRIASGSTSDARLIMDSLEPYFE